jgi:hypothetical protein
MTLFPDVSPESDSDPNSNYNHPLKPVLTEPSLAHGIPAALFTAFRTGRVDATTWPSTRGDQPTTLHAPDLVVADPRPESMAFGAQLPALPYAFPLSPTIPESGMSPPTSGLDGLVWDEELLSLWTSGGINME